MPRYYHEDNLHVDRIERTRRLIWRRPGITGTELARATNSNSYLDRDDIILQLVEDNAIEIQVVKNERGRASKRHWPFKDRSRATQQDDRGYAQGQATTPGQSE